MQHLQWLSYLNTQQSVDIITFVCCCCFSASELFAFLCWAAINFYLSINQSVARSSALTRIDCGHFLIAASSISAPLFEGNFLGTLVNKLTGDKSIEPTEKDDEMPITLAGSILRRPINLSFFWYNYIAIGSTFSDSHYEENDLVPVRPPSRCAALVQW